MAPIRYSLHYEDYSEHLMSRFGKLLQMQSLVDMTLMCSSHTLRVHKAVLSASSAYFQDVLQKQVGEPMIILKMRFSVLKCLVEFMYCGKTQCLEENLDELVSAAQFLKIKGLSKVTKEGLGLTSSGELPIFTPPVVINRPPQSLIDLSAQDPSSDLSQGAAMSLSTGSASTAPQQSMDVMQRGKEGPISPRRARRHRMPIRPPHGRMNGWEPNGILGRAAERALLRREQDSRKAIHHLKHLQTRQMQEYMDRVTLSQAVSSICGPETSAPHNYMSIDNDLMYMDQTVTSNALDPTMPFSKEHSMVNDPMSQSYSTTPTLNTSTDGDSGTGSNATMSQYVNALKSAGLPTDLPILFESGDGSYINVNEQVLMDMVQSNEIQYEVIEQPNIIEKVADPSEIKSIDDLSKSIERGEMLIGSKNYLTSSDYGKASQFGEHEDAINSLNSILPNNLDSFSEQQNFVVLDSRLQENTNAMDSINTDFSCIDGDMQFFNKAMGDDMRKYYDDQHLNDARVMEQLCPTSTGLDTSFNMSLLDKNHLDENLGNQYNLNTDDLRRHDCYDFGLPRSIDFKEDALDCMMATPKPNDDERDTFDASQLEKSAHERDEIIKDLMNIEDKFKNQISNLDTTNDAPNVDEYVNKVKENDLNNVSSKLPAEWNSIEDNVCTDNQCEERANEMDSDKNSAENSIRKEFGLMANADCNDDQWESVADQGCDKENDASLMNQAESSTLEEDIPFAVGLLPMKSAQQTEEPRMLRSNQNDFGIFEGDIIKPLKHKLKRKL